ncbi:hypothetical protein [Thiomicrospira sp. S5]|uniref:hypothetical protein n=1 Tax=Thiomicrospira sp. S5 TaxID=1803865 RepID=UPI000F89F5AE|nr:hypothetical protein [Thiomicrospira sp. S5]AZR80916.1 hypothetical protein AYJ59_00580 [Thiomicrospira sp. S5]
MKVDDVPQQADDIYEGETKVVYAVGRDGKLATASTQGWEAEIEALKDAVDEIEQQARDAWQRAQNGDTSPLEYHMLHQRLDVPMLAQAMGKFQWQIRRHFKPAVFNRLSDKRLQQYAKVMGLSVESLKRLPNTLETDHAKS